jgi:hypothetical protein
MEARGGLPVIADWSEESREAALLVIDKTGAMTVDEAREHYAQEFLDHRRKKPNPYMDALRFPPQTSTANPDERVLTDEDLEQAVEEGQLAGQRA